MSTSATPVVIDNGAFRVKSGLASDLSPRDVFPPIIARLDDERVFVGLAARNRNVVTKSVISEQVTDWDDLERTWAYCFESLDLRDLNEHPVLVTQITNNKSEKEKMVEILLEKFQLPAVYLANQSILSLYSQGLTTGLVVNSGLHKTEVTPIYEGLQIDLGRKLNFAGGDVTFNLMANLRKAGWQLDYDSVNRIKETLCYVNVTGSPSSAMSDTIYKLPDGEIVKIGKDLHEVAELLFKPKNHWQGVHEILTETVKRCDRSIQEQLQSNCVISGGNTLLKGFRERLHNEIGQAIIAPADRDISSWIGGSVVASQPNFRHMWISKKEYDKHGSKIIRIKSF